MIKNVNGITYNPPYSINNNTITSGTTSETILNSVLVPANTFKRFDVVGIQSRIRKTTTAGAVTMRLRIGPTLNTSQTQVAVSSGGTAAQTFLPFNRRISLQSLTTETIVFPTTTTEISDHAANSTTTMSTLSINWTVDNYIIITGQPASTSENINCPFIILDLIEGA